MKRSLAKTFGRIVRRHREGLGLSQEELADGAGVHRTYISAIELGKVRLGLDVAKALAVGLGQTLSDLIREAEHG